MTQANMIKFGDFSAFADAAETLAAAAGEKSHLSGPAISADAPGFTENETKTDENMATITADGQKTVYASSSRPPTLSAADLTPQPVSSSQSDSRDSRGDSLLFATNTSHSRSQSSSSALTNSLSRVEDSKDDYLRSLEIAAFAHLVMWSKNADKYQRQRLEDDRNDINRERPMSWWWCCCCFSCCGSRTYNLRRLYCCCPNRMCCAFDSSADNTDAHPDEMEGYVFNSTIFGRNVARRYLICCCLPSCLRPRTKTPATSNTKNKKKPCCVRVFGDGRVVLSLWTSPIIWSNLPLEVFVNRIIFTATVAVQVFVTYTQWWFFLSMFFTRSVFAAHASTKIAMSFSMFLPELVHIVWLSYTPGYALRGWRRRMRQCCNNSISLTAPIYEWLWSSKFQQLFPYVTLSKKQGLIVSQKGIHERYIIYQGLMVCLRELPFKLFQIFLLSENWTMWDFRPEGLLTTFLGNGDSVKEESYSACGILAPGMSVLDPNMLPISLALAFIVSAVALSDQLKCQIPDGAFPERIGLVLSNQDCQAITWNLLFWLAFVADFVLRALTIVPLIVMEGLLPFAVVFALLFANTSFMTIFALTDVQESEQTLAKAGPRQKKRKRRSSVWIPGSTSSLTGPNPDSEEQKSTSETSAVTSSSGAPRIRKSRREENTYDEGNLLDAVHMVPERCCCSKRRSIRCALAIETLPQVVWGLWVDLPLRAKWLRLARGSSMGTKKQICCWTFDRSFIFFVLSSFNSMVVLSSVFVFNYFNVQQTWAKSHVYCKLMTLSHIPCSNVTCPASILSGSSAVATARELLSGIQHLNHSSWTGGCVPNNNASSMGRTWCAPHMRGGFTDKNGAPLEAWQFLHEVHQINFDLGSWLFVAFVAALIIKVLLCSLIGWKFFYSCTVTRCQCCRSSNKVCSCLNQIASCFAYCVCCGCLKCSGSRRAGSDSVEAVDAPSDGSLEGVGVAELGEGEKSMELSEHVGSILSVGSNDANYIDTLGISNSNKSVLSRSQSNSSRSSSVRRTEMAYFFANADIWRSKLRARDIQLMMRAARIMPRRQHLTEANKQDFLKVEWGKYLLGSGGNVDEGLISKAITRVREMREKLLAHDPFLDGGLSDEVEAAMALGEQAAAQGMVPPLSSLSLHLSSQGSDVWI